MVKADEIMESMVNINRKTYVIYKDSIEKKKKMISEKILNAKTIEDMGKVLKTVNNLIIDMNTLRQLELEYNNLIKGKNYV